MAKLQVKDGSGVGKQGKFVIWKPTPLHRELLVFKRGKLFNVVRL